MKETLIKRCSSFGTSTCQIAKCLLNWALNQSEKSASGDLSASWDCRAQQGAFFIFYFFFFSTPNKTSLEASQTQQFISQLLGIKHSAMRHVLGLFIWQTAFAELKSHTRQTRIRGSGFGFSKKAFPQGLGMRNGRAGMLSQTLPARRVFKRGLDLALQGNQTLSWNLIFFFFF